MSLTLTLTLTLALTLTLTLTLTLSLTLSLTLTRTNLAVLIEHAMTKSTDRVFYHITNNGDPFPGVKEFYESIGAPLPERATLFPALGGAHLLVEPSPYP